ncbi:RxLR effector protein [Phytophthora megakarya]|uniref:RxLR effector protein n=1 Tax=Phytophthora megakarya TaxID=4795 RepID=A0A225W799_9STRA|nr:RxLR effector protein [Phytophthora megakarya]
MGLHTILLVHAIAAILLVGVTSENTNLKVVAVNNSTFIAEQSVVPTKRSFRPGTTQNHEERTIIGLDKVATPLKTRASKIAHAAKLKFWLATKQSPLDALAKLKLNNGLKDALANPKLKVLEEYLAMLNNKYPQNQVSLLGTLATHYDEDVLANALSRAKRYENTKDIATRLQTEQLEGWLNSQKSVNDVFTLLKFKEDGVKFMINQKPHILDEYVKLFNLKNPQQKSYAFKAIMNGFGEDKLAILAWKASQDRRRSLSNTATNIEYILFQRWIFKRYDPATVLIKVFKVDENRLRHAGALEKSVVAEYKPIYNRVMGLDQVVHVVNPRRS